MGSWSAVVGGCCVLSAGAVLAVDRSEANSLVVRSHPPPVTGSWSFQSYSLWAWSKSNSCGVAHQRS